MPGALGLGEQILGSGGLCVVGARPARRPQSLVPYRSRLAFRLFRFRLFRIESHPFQICRDAPPPMNVSAITKVQPSEEDVALAREARRTLEAVLKAGAGTRQVDFRDGSGRVQTVRMPASALQLLQDVLDQIEKGCAVSIVPTHTELTTQEAAQMLGVSRPFFVQMLERGDIPFHKIGTHRRVRYRDVVDYKKRLDAQRHQALEELATQAQALDMGY